MEFAAQKFPLVTIGMPVRNGGALFREALASVVEQDYPNLEVIVSDNCSTDETAETVREFQSRYPFIRYVRQVTPLGIFDNFRFVLTEAKGEFFAWAAHDDTRSPNFVSRLVEALADEEAILAFCDLLIRRAPGGPIERKAFDFLHEGLSPSRRMHKQAFLQCYNMYGLWRTRDLRRIRWAFTPWWTDWPLLVTAAGLRKFVQAPGAEFIYLEIEKTDAERTLYQELSAPASRVSNFSSLLRATWLTGWWNLPLHLAVWAVVLVTSREVGTVARWLPRRFGVSSAGS